MAGPSFRFRLERVRALRERAEDEAKEAFAASMQDRNRSEREMEEAARRVAAAREAQLDTTAAPVNATELIARQAYLERSERAHQVSKEDLYRREQTVELRREDMERLWPLSIGGIRSPHRQTQSGSSGANAEIEGPDASEEPDSLPTARPPTPAGFRTTNAVAVEDACREHIAALSERPQNKETAFAEAREAVKSSGHLSRKAFERAWRDKVPSAWRKAGCRGKPQ